MIWGELVDQLREVHLGFLDQFGIHPRAFLQDCEIHCDDFPYPAASEDYGDWIPAEIPEKIAEAIELHPVERILLEGPILPIQEVRLNQAEWNRILETLIRLERQWLSQTRLLNEESYQYFETQIRTRIQNLQRRSGATGLRAL